MYKEVLSSIDGVSIFPVIAILVFFVFFVLLVVYVIRMDKSKIEEMASLPVEKPTTPKYYSKISLNGQTE